MINTEIKILDGRLTNNFDDGFDDDGDDDGDGDGERRQNIIVLTLLWVAGHDCG